MIEEASGVTDPTAGGPDIGRRDVGLKLWLSWVAASAAGFLLGWAVYAALIDVYGNEIARASISAVRSETIGLALALAFVFAVRGAAVGAAQWLVLRTQLPLAGWWVLATAAAYGLAGALVSLGPTVLALFVGTGLLQWVYLRAHVSRAGWWIPATLVAHLPLLINPPASLIGTVLVWLIAGAFYGAIAGFVFVWLLRQTPAVEAPTVL